MSGVNASDELNAALRSFVASEIGAFARPEIIQFAPGLPKTRSGKIMRRILRKIAANELDNLGDTTTLADPEVVAQLIDNRANR
jgi:acetyl-CoA synthetase